MQEGHARIAAELGDVAPSVESNVRKYAPYTLRHAMRRWWTTRGIGSIGEGVYVDRNVQLLRHPENIHLGAKVMLKEGARICTANPRASISIGDWTTVGYQCFMFATTRIVIGDNCLIAPFCYLVDSDHGIARGTLIREQPMRHAAIRIGSDVWLGVGVIVTAGVTIGDGAVIGARAVVTEDIPPYAVAVGSPARVIRYRQ
jgi:acetyltransferase-like isoleucine patch superfamily enzyme